MPTAVPTIRRVSGKTSIISIKNGTERRRLIITLSTFISALGRGRTPPFSPATSSTPSGSPMIIAKSVESRVTYIVSQIANGNSVFSISRASVKASEVNALSNIFRPPQQEYPAYFADISTHVQARRPPRRCRGAYCRIPCHRCSGSMPRECWRRFPRPLPSWLSAGC